MYLSDYHTHSRLSFDAHAPLSELAEHPDLPQRVSVETQLAAILPRVIWSATTGPPPWPSISRPSPPPGSVSPSSWAWSWACPI